MNVMGRCVRDESMIHGLKQVGRRLTDIQGVSNLIISTAATIYLSENNDDYFKNQDININKSILILIY